MIIEDKLKCSLENDKHIVSSLTITQPSFGTYQQLIKSDQIHITYFVCDANSGIIK